MADVRQRNGTPNEGDFISSSGTPVVVDVDTGACYVLLDDQSIYQINKATTSSVIGSVQQYGGDTAPDLYLLCDGSAVSRTTYSDLFGVIGEKFGNGDGSTTFNLPDMQDKFPLGKGSNSIGDTGGSKDAVVVQHTHTDSGHSHTDSGHAHTDSGHNHGNGGLSVSMTTNTGTGSIPVRGSGDPIVDADIEGSTASGAANISSNSANIQSSTANISTEGESGTGKNMPPYLVMNYIIYAGV